MMLTGYTAGLLDGSIKSFKEFGMICARAFGATKHMRDDTLDTPYTPMLPSSYYLNAVQEKIEKIEEEMDLSDEEAAKRQIELLNKEKEQVYKRLKKIDEGEKTVNGMLHKVISWIPPTPDHDELKTFMIEQLHVTGTDSSTKGYYKNKLKEIDEALASTTPEKMAQLREERIEKLISELNRLLEEAEKEHEKCQQANEWVETLQKSLEEHENFISRR